jgi:hypothetical protein
MDRMRTIRRTDENGFGAGFDLAELEIGARSIEAEKRSGADLEMRLGTSLQAARGNEDIRQRLGELVRDRERFGDILRTFGPSHAHVLDLLAIARHVRAKHGELPRLGAQALAIRHLRTLLPNRS